MTTERHPTRRHGRPGRPRDPHADTAILRAAVDVLIERGIEQTSIEQIARRAGVTKVTVYRRWRTKEDLLAQAIESVRADLPTVEADVRAGASLSEVLEHLLPRWGALLAEPRFRLLAARLLAAGPDHPALLEAYRRHHLEPRRERARALLRLAQDSGELDPSADIDVLIDMMEGAIISRLLLSTDPVDPGEITRYLRAVLRQAGFLPRRS
ncbi:MAG TPA: TetR/AcrR family transcriptional regulator [Actinopolymorphaceae bacterium]